MDTSSDVVLLKLLQGNAFPDMLMLIISIIQVFAGLLNLLGQSFAPTWRLFPQDTYVAIYYSFLPPKDFRVFRRPQFHI